MLARGNHRPSGLACALTASVCLVLLVAASAPASGSSDPATPQGGATIATGVNAAASTPPVEPSPSPSAKPSDSAPTVQTPTRRANPVVIAAATPTTTASLSASSVGLVVTTSAAVLTGFTYVGNVAVPTPNGPVTTMEFTAASASLANLRIDIPCTAVPALSTGMTSVTGTEPSAAATAAHGLHFYATSVAGTTGGTALTWTPDTPPPPGPLGDVTMTAVTIHATWMSMPSLSASGLAQHTAFCAP